MDLLDDIFSEPSTVKAPTRAKFQPKAKPRPKKGTSRGSNQLLQPNNYLNKNLDLPSTPSIAATEKTIARGEDILTDGNLASELGDFVGSTVAGHSEIAISKGNGDRCWTASVSLVSQDAKGALGQSTKEENTSGFPNVVFASASPFRPCNGHGLSLPSASQEPEYSRETLVGSAGDFQIDIEQETVDFSFLETVDMTSDTITHSGNRAVKFKPKPKAQSTTKANTAVVVSHLPDAAKVPSKIQQINTDGLRHADEMVTVADLSLVRHDGDFSTDDNAATMVARKFSKERGNKEQRKVSDVVAFSYDSPGVAVSLGVAASQNGYNHEIQVNSSSPYQAINEAAVNSDECIDDYRLEEETSKNKLKYSKKVSSEIDKTNRKRRKEANEPEESTKTTRKKFPHTTRRKRSVDKSLLDAPDDEIDLRTVPIRDLIILAEHKERQVNKQAAAVQPPSTSERGENSLHEDPTYNEDETYGSDQDRDSLDNPSTSRVVQDTGCFNYQSFVIWKHKRWSKHETELFYQGLQEFGSDFTMIQQRYFPDRSRHQIKLKYKKEEREHPMRIHDALTSRAKDLSHFEVLIQKLQEQEQAAQEKADQSDDDNLMGSTGEEDEARAGETQETHGTSQEAVKHEQNGPSAAPNQEPDDTAPVESPASEEEFDWNHYKSGL